MHTHTYKHTHIYIHEGVSKWYSSLPLGELYSYFLSQSSEFCRHNPLCYFLTSFYSCKHIFLYRLSPETFGYIRVHTYIHTYINTYIIYIPVHTYAHIHAQAYIIWGVYCYHGFQSIFFVPRISGCAVSLIRMGVEKGREKDRNKEELLKKAG
jgi:hypothetical protein